MTPYAVDQGNCAPPALMCLGKRTGQSRSVWPRPRIDRRLQTVRGPDDPNSDAGFRSGKGYVVPVPNPLEHEEGDACATAVRDRVRAPRADQSPAFAADQACAAGSRFGNGEPMCTTLPSGSVSRVCACPTGNPRRPRARREAGVYILDVQIDVAGRDSVEAVLGQVQLRRAATQPHIQRPVWPEGVLRFDSNPSCAYQSTLARASATCKIGAIPSIAPPASWDRWHGTPDYRHKPGEAAEREFERATYC